MSPTGALAITALVLALLATVAAFMTDMEGINYIQKKRRVQAAIILTVLSAAGFITSAWWEALR